MTNSRKLPSNKSKVRTKSLDSRKVDQLKSKKKEIKRGSADSDSGAEASLGSEAPGSSPGRIEMNICSNSDKHLISCEHHERFHQQFHSEALCCKCRPRLEMEKMNRNQQAALMQQQVMSAAGVNNSGGGFFQQQQHQHQQSQINPTGQAIVNGVMKVLEEKSKPNTAQSNGYQHDGNKAACSNGSGGGSLLKNQRSNTFASLINQKRCDYNCSSCQNIKDEELYPGATPPPVIQFTQPPKPINIPGAFGDYHFNSAPSMMGSQENPAWSSGGLGGSFFQPGMGNGGFNAMGGGAPGFSGYPQTSTRPMYPSPFSSNTFPASNQSHAAPAHHFSQYRQTPQRAAAPAGGMSAMGKMPMGKTPFSNYSRNRF